MTEFKKIFEIVLKATPFAYILGFFVINGYLTNYDFSEYNILNLTFLKTGILLSLFITIVIVSVYFCYHPETMSDNLKKSWPSSLLAIYNLHSLIFILLPIFRDTDTFIEKNPLLTNAIIFLKLLLVLYILWASYKKPRNTKSILLITVPPIILIALILFIYSRPNPTILYLWIAILVLGIKTILTLGDIGDNNYKIGMTQDFIFLIVFAFLFGKFFYPKIPSKYGGGTPYKIALSKNQDILFDTSTIRVDTFNVMYENESRFFLQNRNNEMFSLDKAEVKTYIIVKNSR
jgi:hypothetical protein